MSLKIHTIKALFIHTAMKKDFVVSKIEAQQDGNTYYFTSVSAHALQYFSMSIAPSTLNNAS